MKRLSDGEFAKVGRDAYYTTDPKAHIALVQHLPNEYFTYIEPCAGAGDLIKGIQYYCPLSNCVMAIDIDPAPSDDILIIQADALKIDFPPADYIITNPPFSREYKKICIAILEKSIKAARVGVWFLLPHGWSCNRDFQPYMKHCAMIVPIGRVKWFQDSDSQESSDSVWMFFVKDEVETIFKERTN